MLLRLQILWSRVSILFTYGFHTDAMCRLYIGVSFGLLEPAFLLMVLFSCIYSVTPHQPPSETSSPNLNIFALAVGLTIPMCAAQVFAALFSKIITQLRYHELLLSQFFKASYPVQPQQCPGDETLTDNCAVCVFPEFSTLISAAFTILYMAVFWHVTGKIARTAINKSISMQIRTLQVCVTVIYCSSVAFRGVTVLFHPYTLWFEFFRIGHALATFLLIVSVSFLLVWKPVRDGRIADRQITLQTASSTGQPTELLPLVHFKHFESADTESDAGSKAV
jgi:hypothetical protein